MGDHEMPEGSMGDEQKQIDVDLDDIQGKIFIGGLSWQTTEANLRFYFEKFGELSDVALMIDKRTGKPRGFGFIKMKDPAAADLVMASEHTIDGRLVDVKRALPRDKAPGPSSSKTESCKVFVGGLAAEVGEPEFQEYFSKFGAVKDAVVMVDRNTGRSRGFGFITFEREDTVDQLLRMEHEIMGKFVEIKRAEPRAESRGGGGGYDGGYSMGGGGQGGGYAGYGGYGGGYGGGRGGGGRGGMGGRYGARSMGMNGGDGYGGYGGYGGAMRGSSPYGAQQGGGARYPAGYGGAPAYRATGTGYGYAPTASGGMGYYGAAGAPGGGPAMGNNVGMGVSGYSGASGYSARDMAGVGQYGAPNDYGGRGAGGAKGGYDNNAVAAGYASAAAMQMRQSQPGQYSYGGNSAGGAANSGTMAGYGGAYGGATGYNAQGTSPDMNGAQTGAAGYGSYRGQGGGPTQGRVERSYRPY